MAKRARSGSGVSSLGAVVVNRDAGDALLSCVASLREAGVEEIVVVDNASSDGSLERLAKLDRSVVLVPTGRNLGYGRAVNLGARRVCSKYLLVCNPDLIVKDHSVERLVSFLDQDDDVALVGPLIYEPDGAIYPSARAFPSYGVALGHALVGLVWPQNPWTRRYRLEGRSDTGPVDWVSGACMCVRRLAFDSVGGFDEGYFMYVEDLDLCWRLRRAGWGISYLQSASVTHLQGVSTRRRPYLMIAAHHRSTWRFATRSTKGASRAFLPLVAALLGARLVVALGLQALRDHRRTGRAGER